MERTINDDIKKLVEEYYRKLEYLYVKANTISKERRLESTIGNLNYFCSEDCFNLIDVNNSLFRNYMYMESKFFNFFDNAYDNMHLLKDLSLKTIHTYRKVDYPYYKKYKRTDYIPFSDIIKLINEFFMSFGDDSINEFMNKICDNYYYTSTVSDDYARALFALPVFKKYIVHLNNKYPQNLYFASALAHEMGHAYETELYYKSDSTYLSNKHTDTIFFEVVSSFFEYAFINFLKENRYYKKEIDHELDIYYIRLFEYAFNTYVVCLNGINNIDGNYMILLDNKDKMDRIEELKNMLNYYNNLPNYKDKISVLDSFIYFVGEILAVNLYDKYKDNPKEFMKNFRTALVNYPRSGNIESFEVVGITKDELLSGRVLKRELNKFIKDK